jgi:hypothetical protein
MKGLGLKSYKNTITNTQALVISLAKSLPDSETQDYTLYLDNLFNNIFLADALAQCNGTSLRE